MLEITTSAVSYNRKMLISANPLRLAALFAFRQPAACGNSDITD